MKSLICLALALSCGFAGFIIVPASLADEPASNVTKSSASGGAAKIDKGAKKACNDKKTGAKGAIEPAKTPAGDTTGAAPAVKK